MSLHKHVDPYIGKLKELVAFFHHEKSDKKYDELKKIISKLNLIDLNAAIFRCNEEEQDMGNGVGTYNIPNFGSMVYCGTQGFISFLSEIAPNNDLGHPFCNNLREGNWMIGKYN